MSSWCPDGQCWPWDEHGWVGLGEDESTPNSCCSGGWQLQGRLGLAPGHETRVGGSKLILCPRKGTAGPMSLQCGLVRTMTVPLAHLGLGDVPRQRWKIKCFPMTAGLGDCCGWQSR